MPRDRLTSPPDTGLGGDRPDARRGTTQTEQGETQHTTPRMPYERDDSADSQARHEPSQERVGAAAQKDAQSGVQDTSKAPELDDAYERVKSGEPDGRKQFRP